MIRLDLNENPYPPPRSVLEEAEKGLREVNRYCEQACLDELKRSIEEYTGIPWRSIKLSPGSDTILREIIHSFSIDRKVIMLNPSFLPTLECAKRHSRKMVKFHITPPEFILKREILQEEAREPSLVIIDNPNNPTGREFLDKDLVVDLLDNKNTLLVIDEAYYEFSGNTFSNLVNEYGNLAVTRTLDKAFSLAGLRVGYLLAGEKFMEGLSDFNVILPRPSVYAAIAALKNMQYVMENARRIRSERKRLIRELNKLGIEAYKSSTNFILVKSEFPGLGDKLRVKGIAVRDLSRDWIPGYYRISVGLPEENNILLETLKEILADESNN
ncbi:MAG: histidinol-phosphate aminotransferase family protein [Desulfurococcales archaeon]|nr:histidinol-phosphate aminotransferase family protein [Desulfurococcales archaeon]